MEELLDGLNDMQRQAVLATDGPLLVLAGAGSGKTTVLTKRIAYILALKKARPWEILAITFTNKAAKEMADRIAALVPDSASDMWIKTFHSACLRILRKDIDRLGYTSNFNIYDTSDQKRLVKECIKDSMLSEDMYPVKSVMFVISDCKNKGITPDEYLQNNDGDFRAKGYGKIFRRYTNRLKENNALDFDDLLCKTVELFENNPDVLEYYQNKFRYILVDEYQDTNNIQYRLVAMLAQKYRNLCVVGDDDQSIYKFRGADVTNILDFEKQFRDAKVIKLEQNYRSTQNILDAANEVISNNINRKQKKLWTDRGDGAKIIVRSLNDQIGEAQYINNTIESFVRTGEYKYSDFAILYRTNAQTRSFEENLTCPYRILAGLRFYDRREIKDLLSYLRVIFNPADDTNLSRIVNVPKRGIGDTTVGKISALAMSVGKSMFDIITDPGYAEAIGRSYSKIASFAQMINEIRSLVNEISVSELIEVILKRTGYLESLVAENAQEAQGRIENIEELKSKAIEYEEKVENPSFEGFLDNISLVSDVDNYDEEQDAVVLMTLHSAKGLEFPVVFMCGMEYGLFPSMMAEMEEGGIEEERRLCYVGITRAKSRLYMTWARMRTLYGKTEARMITRFISEISAEHLDIEEPAKRQTYSTGAGAGAQSKAAPSFGRASVDSIMNAYNLKRASAVNRPLNTSFAAACDIKKGDRVKHKKFGEGLVLSVTDRSDDTALEISFDNVGTRTLMASFAKLTKI